MRVLLIAVLFSVFSASSADAEKPEEKPEHFYKDPGASILFLKESCAIAPTPGIFATMPPEYLKQMKKAVGVFVLRGGEKRTFQGCWFESDDKYRILFEDGDSLTVPKSAVDKEIRPHGQIEVHI